MQVSLNIFIRFQYKIWDTLEADPLFAHSPLTLPVDEQKRRTALQIDKINKYKFLPDNIIEADYKTKVSSIFPSLWELTKSYEANYRAQV